jgi:hypothetical protein
MNKSDLKKLLKPLIKECIREAIFEEGILSGLITEVAQGLGNINPAPQLRQVAQPTITKSQHQSQTVTEAKTRYIKQLGCREFLRAQNQYLLMAAANPANMVPCVIKIHPTLG